jgi:hypothetical protein
MEFGDSEVIWQRQRGQVASVGEHISIDLFIVCSSHSKIHRCALPFGVLGGPIGLAPTPPPRVALHVYKNALPPLDSVRRAAARGSTLSLIESSSLSHLPDGAAGDVVSLTFSPPLADLDLPSRARLSLSFVQP